MRQRKGSEECSFSERNEYVKGKEPTLLDMG